MHAKRLQNSFKNIKLKPYVFVRVLYTLKQTCNKTTKEESGKKLPLKKITSEFITLRRTFLIIIARCVLLNSLLHIRL